MTKYIISMLLVLALGSGAIYAVPLPEQQGPQKVTEPLWTVVMNFKAKNGLDPIVRIYVAVHAHTEGEAAIRAHVYVAGQLALQAVEQLEYVEAQQK